MTLDLRVGLQEAAQRIHPVRPDYQDLPIEQGFDWPAIAAALRQSSYDGWVTAETFTASIPEIAAATAIWRPIVPDPWTYARESMETMRPVFG